MIESGTGGARFTIENLASPVLKKLMDDFRALQGAIDKVQGALREIRLPPGLGVEIGKLDTSLGTVVASADEMSAKVAAGFGEMDTRNIHNPTQACDATC